MRRHRARTQTRGRAMRCPCCRSPTSPRRTCPIASSGRRLPARRSRDMSVRTVRRRSCSWKLTPLARTAALTSDVQPRTSAHRSRATTGTRGRSRSPGLRSQHRAHCRGQRDLRAARRSSSPCAPSTIRSSCTSRPSQPGEFAAPHAGQQPEPHKAAERLPMRQRCSTRRRSPRPAARVPLRSLSSRSARNCAGRRKPGQNVERRQAASDAHSSHDRECARRSSRRARHPGVLQRFDPVDEVLTASTRRSRGS